MKDRIKDATRVFCRAEIRGFNNDNRQPDGRRKPDFKDARGGWVHSSSHFSQSLLGSQTGALLPGQRSMDCPRTEGVQRPPSLRAQT